MDHHAGGIQYPDARNDIDEGLGSCCSLVRSLAALAQSAASCMSHAQLPCSERWQSSSCRGAIASLFSEAEAFALHFKAEELREVRAGHSAGGRDPS